MWYTIDINSTRTVSIVCVTKEAIPIVENKTACFTGHRHMDAEQIPVITAQLRNCLIQLIDEGYTIFKAGGALGFDTLAAQTVLDLKATHTHIQLVLILPCVSQAHSWNVADQQIYEGIKQRADHVLYTSQQYARGCMHKRNRELVRGSQMCISYLTKPRGGTFYTVQYAAKHGVPVINLAKMNKMELHPSNIL